MAERSPEASPSTASGAFAAAVVGVKFNATNASEDAVDVAAVAVAPASVESSVAATYGGLAAPGDREGNEGGDVSHSE
uniref:Uncharacterized protein n=1 Tax=Panagrolaimus superbus TaxID=310955 RepID=A0A914XYM7_9BILA